MIEKAKLVLRARAAALTALIAFSGMLISVWIRSIGSARTFHWRPAIVVSVGFAFFAFLLLFCWSVISDLRLQPVLDILEDEPPDSQLTRKPLTGFVAMEFYWLILNRTYIVLIAPEGLYGWKAEGPVTNGNRRYFEPYQQMLEDGELMRDLAAIQKLSALRGGFFWRAAEIASVSADDHNQWGMGGIVHSGHVRVRLMAGGSKNFIILGDTIPMDVRDRIISTTGAGLASDV